MILGPTQPPTPSCILYIDVLGNHCSFFIWWRHSCAYPKCLKKLVSSKCRKCISAIKRILYTTAMYTSSTSFVLLHFPFLLTAMHVKNLAFCVWEWRRCTIQYNFMLSFHAFFILHQTERCIPLNIRIGIHSRIAESGTMIRVHSSAEWMHCDDKERKVRKLCFFVTWLFFVRFDEA